DVRRGLVDEVLDLEARRGGGVLVDLAPGDQQRPGHGHHGAELERRDADATRPLARRLAITERVVPALDRALGRSRAAPKIDPLAIRPTLTQPREQAGRGPLRASRSHGPPRRPLGVAANLRRTLARDGR